MIGNRKEGGLNGHDCGEAVWKGELGGEAYREFGLEKVGCGLQNGEL